MGHVTTLHEASANGHGVIEASELTVAANQADASHAVTRVTLVRHGRTAWNAQTRIQGHVDIALDDVGEWQAQRVAESLRDEDVHAIYSSDLARARHTAAPLAQALALDLAVDTGLRERHFGSFEGLTFAQIDQHHVDDANRWRTRDPDFAPSGGETLRHFQARALQAVTRIAAQHAGAHIVVVTHGGVLDAMYRAGSRIAIDAPRSWHIGNASIHRMLLTEQGWTVVGWNDEFHLDAGDEAALSLTSGGS